jgi:hypothetical protein
MRRHDRWFVSTFIAAGLTASGLSGGAALAAGEGPAPAPKAGAPAKLEQVPGSEFNRVVLTQKAAERIALETGVVSEEAVDRWLLVSGEVETIATPSAGAVAAPPAAAGQSSEAAATIPLLTTAPAIAAGPEPVGIVPVRVRVPAIDRPEEAGAQATPVLVLEDDDDDDLDEDDDDLNDALAVVIIRPNGDEAAALKAKPVQVESTDDEAQYYELVNGGSHNLRPGQDVQVRVPHPDNGTPKKVIPLSAVIYSADGKAWTYTVLEPLTFVRHPIEIDYATGDRAVLKEGPAAGTPIVTRGAAELWGVETRNG